MIVSKSFKPTLKKATPLLKKVMKYGFAFFILVSIMFFLFGSWNHIARAAASPSSTITCPHCGEDAYSLFECTNQNCENYGARGCMNTSLDQDGKPKCLYRYGYKAYCRKCGQEAKQVWPN